MSNVTAGPPWHTAFQFGEMTTQTDEVIVNTFSSLYNHITAEERILSETRKLGPSLS